MKHPIQKIKNHRFVENKLVSEMLDKYNGNLNELSVWACENDALDDYDQLLMLIGYSVSGIPFRNPDLHEIVENLEHTETEHEAELAYYKGLVEDLREQLAQPMSVLFNIAPEDLHEEN